MLLFHRRNIYFFTAVYRRGQSSQENGIKCKQSLVFQHGTIARALVITLRILSERKLKRGGLICNKAAQNTLRGTSPEKTAHSARERHLKLTLFHFVSRTPLLGHKTLHLLSSVPESTPIPTSLNVTVIMMDHHKS